MSYTKIFGAALAAVIIVCAALLYFKGWDAGGQAASAITQGLFAVVVAFFASQQMKQSADDRALSESIALSEFRDTVLMLDSRFPNGLAGLALLTPSDRLALRTVVLTNMVAMERNSELVRNRQALAIWQSVTTVMRMNSKHADSGNAEFFVGEMTIAYSNMWRAFDEVMTERGKLFRVGDHAPATAEASAEVVPPPPVVVPAPTTLPGVR